MRLPSTLRGTVLVAVACVIASGCTVQRAGKVRAFDVSTDQFVSTGSQARVIVSSEISPESRPGTVDPIRIICSEPSPDVAVTVANSLSASLSVLGRGSGSISSTSASALAQLVERTATIQLLRDKMYHTCLAYANGAMTRTTYTLVMAKLDQTIVSMLMGENASGAFGRSLSAIGLEAAAETNGTLLGTAQEAIEDLSTQANALKDAQNRVTTAEAALTEKKAAVKEMPTQEQSEAIEQAEKELSAARKERDELLKKLQVHATTLAKTSGKSTVTAAGNISRTPDPLIAQALLEMQEQFLTHDFTESLVSACLTELGAGPKEVDWKAAAVATAEGVMKSGIYGITDFEIAPQKKLEILTSKVVAGLINAKPTWLAEFCGENLKEAMKSGQMHQLEMTKQRAQIKTATAQAQASLAAGSAERARTDRIKITVEAIEKCKSLPGDDTKKICIEKLLPAPG